MSAHSPGLTVPALPDALPASWTARRPLPTDIRAIYALCRACDEVALGVADVSLIDIEADVTKPSADLGRNQLVVLDGARIVAWAWLEDRSAGEVGADLFVHPSLDGPTADALADWAWAFLTTRAVEVTAARGVEEAVIGAGTNDGDTANERWLRRQGFDRQRTFWRMGCDVTDAEVTREPRPGVTIRTVAGTDTGPGSDLSVIHTLHEESFAEHWDFHRRDFDTWWARMQAFGGFDLTLWWIAEVDGWPAGLLLGTNQMADENALYVDTLGTVRAARRRGVAVSLLREAFAEASRRGLGRVCLNVDSENQTGATRLYESTGMRVEFAVHQWQRRVSASSTTAP